MVMTPSLPTFCIALAIIAPISLSPLAEMVRLGRSRHWSRPLRERFWMSVTTASTAASMPRFRSIVFIPAATALEPSRTIACASTAAVVVPSPARSLGLAGDLLDHLGAHVLELVRELDLLGDRDASLGDARGAIGFVEHDVATLGTERHPDGVGENVDAAQHARAGIAMEFNVFCGHVPSPDALGGFLLGGGLVEHAHDVGFLHDNEVLAIELDLGARPLAEEHAVARLDVERVQGAVLAAGAGADATTSPSIAFPWRCRE